MVRIYMKFKLTENDQRLYLLIDTELEFEKLIQ